MSTLRPSASVLRDLYEAQGLSTRAIGAKFGVSKTEVTRWMKHYDIPRRPHTFAEKVAAGVRPDADTLYRLVHERHHSYEEIAAMYKVDPSNIRLWLIAANIPTPEIWDTRRRGAVVSLPDADTLLNLYAEQGISASDIGERYDVSGDTIRRELRRLGIPVRRDGFDGGKRLICADGHEARSTYELRVDNWLHRHGIDHVVEPPIPGMPDSRADFLANGWYIEVWGVTGNDAYRERRSRKTRHYTKSGIPLISLTPWMFSTHSGHSWERRMLKVLNHATSQTSQGPKLRQATLRPFQV